MADDTINYKVNIDASSVADQLQSIKNQVDQAMAMYTFNATLPDPTPRAYAFPGQGFSSQLSNIGSTANTMAMDASVGANMGMQTAQQNALAFMDTARLGFQKFSNDAQNAMLMTPMGVGTPQISPQNRYLPNFSSMGPTRLGFESITGFGYDARMSMTPGRYNYLAGEKLGDNLPEAIQTALDFGTGATAVAGLGAWAMGAPATAATLGAMSAALAVPALGFGAAMGTFGFDVNPALSARSFVRDTSWRFNSGRFSDTASGNIGVQIAGAARAENMDGLRVSQREASEMVREFTQIGGFDNTRTADEFRQKVKTLIESTRYITQQLGVAQSEAVGMMRDWMNQGLVTDTASARAMGTTQAAMAYRAGYTPQEFHAFGMQSAEMVRGTGIMMGAGYLSGQTALSSVRAGMQTGAFTNEMVNQMGGAENMAATINRMGFGFGMSSAGLTYFAARDMVGMGAGSMDPQTAISAATSNIRTLQDYMNFKGGQARMASQVGGEGLFGAETGYYMKMFNKTGQQLNEDSWRTFMGAQNIPAAEADLMFGRIRSASSNTGATRLRGIVDEGSRNIAMGTPNWAQVAVDQVYRGAADFFGTKQNAQDFVNLSQDIQGGSRRIDRWFRNLITTGNKSDFAEIGPSAFTADISAALIKANPNAVERPKTLLQQTGEGALELQKMLDTDKDQFVSLAGDLRKAGMSVDAITDGTYASKLVQGTKEWNTFLADPKQKGFVTAVGSRANYLALRANLATSEGRDVALAENKAVAESYGTISSRLGLTAPEAIRSVKDQADKIQAEIEKTPGYRYTAGWFGDAIGMPANNSFTEMLRKVEGVGLDSNRLVAYMQEFNQFEGNTQAYTAMWLKRGVALKQAEAYTKTAVATSQRQDVKDLMANSMAAQILNLSPETQAEVAKELGVADVSNVGNIAVGLKRLKEKGAEGEAAGLRKINASLQQYYSTADGAKLDKLALAKQNVALDTEIQGMLSTITGGADLSVAEKQAQATSRLIVNELRSITAIMGNKTLGKAFPVYVTNQK